MIKIFYADLAQRIRRVRMEVIGVHGLDRGGRYGNDIGEYLYSYATTMGGGTSEVQRDIVGERVLGLPRNR